MRECTRVHQAFSPKLKEARIILRKKVAKLAGVSEATVSRVLSGVGPVREATRERVLAAARQLDYVPSALAQRFARSKSGNLGVILPLLPKVNLFSTYYFSEILSGVGVTAKELGYDLLLLFRKPDEPRDYATLFRTQKVDGCIILGAQDVPAERAALEELAQGGYPFCLVHQRFDGANYNTVDADQRKGLYDAARQLIAQGHRSLLFLNGPPVYSNSLDRLEGYRQALEEAGIAFDPSLVLVGNYSRKSGYEYAQRVAGLIAGGQASAVVAANDRMAIGLLQGLKERGLRAGEHFALIGCDDSESARLTEPALSSIQVPFYQAGHEAAARLIERIAGEPGAQDVFTVKLPVQLVLRASSEIST